MCWQVAPEDRTNTLEALLVRSCNLYVLGPIAQVHARSQRRMFFTNDGVVALK